MKRWQRYFFRKISISFFFILFCLFSIFVLVDLSVNGVKFFTRGESIGLNILIYYCLQFAKRLDLFFPIAFLLASIKTLFDLSSHLELVALQTAGVARKTLLLPFFSFALCLTLVGYANHEWVAPRAVKDINAFKRSKSRKLHRKKNIQTMALEDGSELIYQTFDPKTNEFFDLFWVCSPKEIWMMQSLSFAKSPVGKAVDHLIRTSSGLLEKVESFDLYSFQTMPMSQLGIPGQITPFEGRPLSVLYRESFRPTLTQSSAQTHLHRKLALPLLPLLALVAIAPFTMTFSRHKKAFSLVAFSVFGFALFMTLYDSLIILGEHRMIIPIAAMWLPILAAFAFTGRRFWNMR